MPSVTWTGDSGSSVSPQVQSEADARAANVINWAAGNGGHASKLTFVSDVLRRAGEPASAVAWLAQGKPGKAGGNLADIFRVHPTTQTIGLSDVPVIHRATASLPWYVRGPLRFGIDVAGDPLTYLSFGGGAALKDAGKVAAEQLAKDAAAHGGRPLITDVAKAAVTDLAEQAAAKAGKKGLQVSARVPLTRDLSIPLFRIPSIPLPATARQYTEKLAQALDTPGQWVKPTRGVSKGTNYIAQTVRRYAQQETGHFTRMADALNAEVYARAAHLPKGTQILPEETIQALEATGVKGLRGNGVAPRYRQLRAAVTLTAEGVPGFQAIVGVTDLAAKLKQHLTDLGQRELADGIERGSVAGDYVPHMLADKSQLDRFTLDHPDMTASAADHPFFVHERSQPGQTIMDLVHAGYRMELDPGQLLKARAAASAKARIKRTMDQVFAERGVKALQEIPATDAQRAAANQSPDVAAARDRLSAAQTEAAKSHERFREFRDSQVVGSEDALRRAETRALAEATAPEITPQMVARDPKVAAARREVATTQTALRMTDGVKGVSAQRRALTVRLQAAQRRAAQAEQALTTRVTSKATAKAEQVMAANEKLLSRPGRVVSATELAQKAQDGWRGLDTSHSYLTGVLLSPKDQKELQQVHQWIADSMRQPAAAQRFLLRLQSMWKRYALLTPGFQERNALDDGLRSWFFGARNPVSYMQAAQALRGGKAAIKLGKGRVVPMERVLEDARSWGVIDLGFVASDVRPFEQGGRGISTTLGRGRFLNAARGAEKVGNARENWMRMGLFLEQLKRGYSVPRAAEMTRKALFDYGEVSAFTDTARRYWIPFITYSSKVIPQTMRLWAENPRIPSHIGMLTRQVNQTAVEEGANPDLSQLPAGKEMAMLLPPQIADPLANVLGGKSRVPGAPAPTLMVNPEGVFGYTQGNMLDPRNASQTASNMLTPFLTKPYEVLSNHSLYYGRDYHPGERLRANLVEQALAKVPGLGGAFGPKYDKLSGTTTTGIDPRIHALLSLIPTIGQVSSAGSMLDQGGSGSSLSAARYWLGIPITSFDRAQAAYWAARGK